MNPVTRSGCLDDSKAINDIYNWYVDNSTITFDLDHWDVPRREQWMNQFLPENVLRDDRDQPLYHLVVATLDDQLLGFAYNGPFKSRAAYQSSTEVTIYTRPDPQPTVAGIGSQLYGELFKRIARTPLHRAYAIIALPNHRSIGLHKKFGFRHIGTLSEVGTKFDRRIDVAWYEKHLD